VGATKESEAPPHPNLLRRVDTLYYGEKTIRASSAKNNLQLKMKTGGAIGFSPQRIEEFLVNT
jgi:hypothetical protein